MTYPISWFAVTVKPNHEITVSRGLMARDLEAYVPTYQARRSWSDRVKVAPRCLIPGYVFTRFDRNQRTKVLQTECVTSVVKFAGECAPIPDCEIESLKVLVSSGYPLEPWDSLVAGQKVQIVHGPLTGAQGVFVKRRGAVCLAVSIELLGRSVIACVDQEVVVPGSRIDEIVKQQPRHA